MTARRAAVLVAACLGVAALVAAVIPDGVRTVLHTYGHLHVWYHLGLFAVLGVLSVAGGRSWPERVHLALLACVLGLVIEYAEGELYDGWLEWSDVLTDAMGVALGFVLAGAVLLLRGRGQAS